MCPPDGAWAGRRRERGAPGRAPHDVRGCGVRASPLPRCPPGVRPGHVVPRGAAPRRGVSCVTPAAREGFASPQRRAGFSRAPAHVGARGARRGRTGGKGRGRAGGAGRAAARARARAACVRACTPVARAVDAGAAVQARRGASLGVCGDWGGGAHTRTHAHKTVPSDVAASVNASSPRAAASRALPGCCWGWHWYLRMHAYG